MPQLPEVAPLAEGAPGLAGYELLNWFALFAPAATPEPMLGRLHEVVSAALADTALAAKLDVQGIVTRSMNLAELRAFVRAEADNFGRIAVAANIKVE